MKKAAFWSVWLAVSALVGLSLWLHPGRPSPPRLAVIIVVDQLRSDYLTRFAELYQGGFKSLLENGANFTNSAYRHASTYTAAGHASVSTGLHPASHGMINNSWYDPTKDAIVNCIADDAYVAVGGPGRAASPRPLLADTIGDLLKKKHGGSKVYSISSKDRAALTLAGRGADGAFWYSPDCGCFVTSSYYENGLPPWLATFNATQPTAAYAGKSWQRLLDDPSIYEKLARADIFPTEANGEASSFPHVLPAENVTSKLSPTPYADELTLNAALAAINSGEFGSDGEPDLLAIGFSGTDYVGHSYGPHSQEAMDQNLRLDRHLATLLDAIDKQVGLDHAVVALTADHGVLPLVEHLQNTGVDAHRLDPKEFWQRATDALTQQFSEVTRLVAAARDDHLYWHLPAFRDGSVKRVDAEEFLVEWLRKQPFVAEVYTASDLSTTAADAPEITKLFANSYFERRSPHVIVRFDKYVYPGNPVGTSHGTVYRYDREVPVLLFGAGIRRGAYDKPTGPEDIAPTLAKIFGLRILTEPDTRVLSEALR